MKLMQETKKKQETKNNSHSEQIILKHLFYSKWCCLLAKPQTYLSFKLITNY